MKFEPDTIDYVIVLIKVNDTYHWYVSEKEMWILDLLKLDNDFRRKMNRPLVEETTAEDERSGYELLDETNIIEFMMVIKEYEVELQDLIVYFESLGERKLGEKELLKKLSFFINFDSKCFYSFYKEPGSYEEYTPKGWDGIFLDNIEKIIRNNNFFNKGEQ